MQAKKARQRCVVNRKTSSNSVSNVFSYERNSCYKACNYRCSSKAHLPSWENVTNERGSHHEKKNNKTRVSQRTACKVRLVVEVTRHVHVHKNKYRGCPVCMAVAKDISTVYVGHDMFNRRECSFNVWCVMHSKNDSCKQL